MPATVPILGMDPVVKVVGTLTPGPLGRIVDLASHPDYSTYRGYIQDTASLLLDHLCNNCFGKIINTFEIGIDDVIPIILCH